MSDILIRDVPESTVAEIDRRASNLVSPGTSTCAAGWTTEIRAEQPVTAKTSAGSAGLPATWPTQT